VAHFLSFAAKETLLFLYDTERPISRLQTASAPRFV